MEGLHRKRVHRSDPASLVLSNSVIVNNYLVRFLSPISVIALRRAFPPLHLVGYSLAAIVHSALLVYFEGEPHVANCIFEFLQSPNHSYRLTGGFLFALLHGDDVTQCSDIDIITSDVRLEEGRHNYGASNSNLVGMLKDALMSYPYVRQSVDGYADTTRALKAVFEYTTRGKKSLQLLAVDDNRVRRYVSSFDFRFVRNTYGCGGDLRICEMDSVITKRCQLDMYEAYLFKSLPANLPNLIHNVMPKIYARICKYMEQRGCEIIVSNLTAVNSIFGRAKLAYKNTTLFGEDMQGFKNETSGWTILLFSILNLWRLFWDERLDTRRQCILPNMTPAYKLR